MNIKNLFINKNKVKNDKIDNLIKWHKENLDDGTKTDMFYEKLRLFVEKMAVWYELRYPDYEIMKSIINGIENEIPNEIIDNVLSNLDDEIPNDLKENKNVDIEMFLNNPYIEEITKDYVSKPEALDWDKFYNYEAFLNSLPNSEKKYLENPSYPEQLYLKILDIRIDLSKDGYVENFNRFPQLNGIHITEFIKTLPSLGIILPEKNIIKDTINHYNNLVYFKEELLNCVMHRIIKRGARVVGSKRAVLFSKEFNIDIDVALAYNELSVLELCKLSGEQIGYNNNNIKIEDKKTEPPKIQYDEIDYIMHNKLEYINYWEFPQYGRLVENVGKYSLKQCIATILSSNQHINFLKIQYCYSYKTMYFCCDRDDYFYSVFKKEQWELNTSYTGDFPKNYKHVLKDIRNILKTNPKDNTNIDCVTLDNILTIYKNNLGEDFNVKIRPINSNTQINLKSVDNRLEQFEICYPVNNPDMAYYNLIISYDIDNEKYSYQYLDKEYDNIEVLLKENENKLLSNIFVKIDDCPEHMQEDLYNLRMSELNKVHNEKVEKTSKRKILK